MVACSSLCPNMIKGSAGAMSKLGETIAVATGLAWKTVIMMVLFSGGGDLPTLGIGIALPENAITTIIRIRISFFIMLFFFIQRTHLTKLLS